MSNNMRIATKIIDGLLTNAGKQKGDRLAIKQSVVDRPERDLGGWCRAAAIQYVEKILESEKEGHNQ